MENLKAHYSFWKVERLWSWKEKLVENFVENLRKLKRQKTFKNSHVETVETEKGIFVENGLEEIPDTPKNCRNFGAILSFHKLWKTLLKTFGKSVENRKSGFASAKFFRWNRNIFLEKRGFTDTIRLHIVEYAAVFSKPEIGNLFAWNGKIRQEKTAMRLSLMGLGFDVPDDIFYQLF